MTIAPPEATIQNRQQATRWQRKYDASAPGVGDPAPDFMLRDLSNEQTVKLSDYLGNKPIVLIFGSFT